MPPGLQAMPESVRETATLLRHFGTTWVQLAPACAGIHLATTPDLLPMPVMVNDKGNPINVRDRRSTDASCESRYLFQPSGCRLFVTGVF